ncbi:MAG: tRNA guanosine(34) transglycosylase Tgt [bacterium]|nr:tRNA guanosine(34) transglycosylase Tgt [bacterium]
MNFTLLKTDARSKARRGVLETPHGTVQTPVFMPVGTQGTVKGLTPAVIHELNAEIILGNTYHLYLRPGMDIMEQAGGLHSFMGWNKPILTDSGGFQVYSLAQLRKITPEGVRFQSHIDGSQHFFTPEKTYEIQNMLGSDIIMVFDECVPYPSEHTYACNSLKITVEWAKKCKIAHKKNNTDKGLFGIVQGSTFKDLRSECAYALQEIGFDGYAIGGLAVGEPQMLLYEFAGYTADILPCEKPRYVMGCGFPEDLLVMVENGIDMFDCVIPTRYARNGTAFTSRGKLPVKNGAYKNDFAPLDPDCSCYVCTHFSRAYLRHLFNTGEMLGPVLLTQHNIHFFLELMRKIRTAIDNDRYVEYKNETMNKLLEGETP